TQHIGAAALAAPGGRCFELHAGVYTPVLQRFTLSHRSDAIEFFRAIPPAHRNHITYSVLLGYLLGTRARDAHAYVAEMEAAAKAGVIQLDEQAMLIMMARLERRIRSMKGS